MRDGKKKFNVPHHGLALLNVHLEATTAFLESVKRIYKKQIYQNGKKEIRHRLSRDLFMSVNHTVNRSIAAWLLSYEAKFKQRLTI